MINHIKGRKQSLPLLFNSFTQRLFTIWSVQLVCLHTSAGKGPQRRDTSVCCSEICPAFVLLHCHEKKKTNWQLFYLFIWEMKWASKRHSSLKIEREGLSGFKTSWAQLMSDFVLQWHLSAFPASSIWTAGLSIVLWTAEDATYRGESSFSHCSQSALRSCLLNNYGGKIPSETPEKKNNKKIPFFLCLSFVSRLPLSDTNSKFVLCTFLVPQ